MNQGDPADLIAPRLLTMRIIVAALCLGVIAFAGVSILIRTQQGQPAVPFGSPLQIVAVVFTASVLPAVWLVPSLVTAGWRRHAALAAQPSEREISPDFLRSALGAYQIELIVGVALLEGPAFLNLVVYLIEGNLLNLGLALGLLLFMAMKFPSRLGVERWLSAQHQLIEDARRRAG